MDSRYRAELPKAVRSILHDPSLHQTETGSMKMSELCDTEYVETLCGKIEALKSEKKGSVAYGDILQVFTNCTKEYSAVYSALEELDRALGALVTKAESAETTSADFIGYIMHKELINNINGEIQRMGFSLRKSGFFRQFLDGTSWKLPPKEKPVEAPRQRGKVVSQTNAVVGKVQPLERFSVRDRKCRNSMIETMPAPDTKSDQELLSVQSKNGEIAELNSRAWRDKIAVTPISGRSHINQRSSKSAVS